MSVKWRYVTVLILTLLPLLLLILSVVTYSVNIPYMDQWDFLPLLQKSYQGTMSWNDFYMQHNEHRIILPRFLMILLAHATQWNIRAELATNILIAFFLFVLLYRASIRLFQSTPPMLTAPILSLIIFSQSQWENWLWGWQLQIFLCLFFVVLGLLLLTEKQNSRICHVEAFLCGIAAIYSFGAGVLFFPVSIILILMRPRLSAWRRIFPATLWLVGSLLIYATYGYHFQHPVSSPLPATQAGALSIYVLAYLGAPVGGFFLITAIAAGLVGVTLFFWVVVQLYVKKNFSPEVRFFCSLGLFALLSALMTAVSRAGFGWEQALSSRYVTIANLLWIATIMLLLFYLRTEEKQKISRNTNVVAMLVVMVIIIMAGISLMSISDFTTQCTYRTLSSERLRRGYPELISGLYPKPGIVEERAQILKTYHLSVFRD